ncbi:MAG TPA: protein kinase, partial [Pyrinomonadaceae bacterium]|nr:protein kinase [Pyrinomonadaceae bacterium]
VKILDFGVAKLTQLEASQSQTEIPTRRVNTDPGVVVGTVGYMSPEQVRGKRVDHRSDIFSLGAILYEMLSGRRAFQGESAADTMSAILKEDPPQLSESNKTVSPALERLVNHCLEKTPEARFHSASDLAFALEALSGSQLSSPEITTEVTLPPSRAKWAARLPWIIAGAAVMLAVVAFAISSRRAPAETPATARFYIYPPEKTYFGGPFAVSPDGRRVVLRGTSEGKSQLWVRALDSLTAQPLAGTEDAVYPFWSPDSRFVGFFAGGKLKKIEVAGGSPQTLCDAADGRGGTWNRDGVIIFTPNGTDALYTVSATGGVLVRLTALDASRKETSHIHPQFLPDGRHFLYLTRGGQQANTGVVVGSLDSKETKRLVNTNAQVAYAQGHLLFMQERTLMAQGFDTDTIELKGEPFPVAQQVDRLPGVSFGLFSVSETGVLMYRSGTAANTQLAWFDRTGKQLGTVGPPGGYASPWLSPDERRVAVSAVGVQGSLGPADIWVVEVARGTMTHFTFDPGFDSSPIWSPDGSRIVFSTSRDGTRNLYQKAASGAGNDELLLKSENGKDPTDWSRDGRFILYQEQNAKTNFDLWILPFSGEQQPFSFLQTDFVEVQGQFSPNGKWIAYTSNQSGTWQIYVQSFPDSGGKWQVSSSGGGHPKWRRDGKELFYVSSDRKLMAVDVKTDGPTFESGVPKALFELPVPGLPGPRNYYVVSGDGQRFLVAASLDEAIAAPTIVVLNWTADLKR